MSLETQKVQYLICVIGTNANNSQSKNNVVFYGQSAGTDQIANYNPSGSGLDFAD